MTVEIPKKNTVNEVLSKNLDLSKISTEEERRYYEALRRGSQAGLTQAELLGLQKVDERLLFNRIDYDEVLALRKGVSGGGTEVLEESIDDVAKSIIKGGSGTFKYKEVKTFTAEETNQWFIDNVKPDYKPPYKPGTVVKEIELTENTTFVRVYDNMPDGSGMYGSWIMKAEDIEGLTPLEIQNKFALPNTPKYVCDVELEVGTHIRVGEVNPLDGWGSGGGTQYDLIGQRIGNFINERLLEGN